jgi:hypothetical protein
MIRLHRDWWLFVGAAPIVTVIIMFGLAPHPLVAPAPPAFAFLAPTYVGWAWCLFFVHLALKYSGAARPAGGGAA